MNAQLQAPLSAPRVRAFEPRDRARWDHYVEDAAEASFFHRAGWCEVITRAFGHRTHYHYAERDGRIVGVLPLVEVKSRLFGHTLGSTPFCVYGGAIADDDAAYVALITEAQALAERLGVDHLELRNRVPRPLVGDAARWRTRDGIVTFRKAILAEEEANYLAIPRKQRAMVRKGMDAGLTGRVDADTTACYAIYSDSVRHLGTPVFGARYFSILREVFGEHCESLIIEQGTRPVAGVLSFYFRDEVLPYYGGGLREARELKANDFMYWALMRRACARGTRLFDYGRSKEGSGSYSFKKNWGFVPEPMFYQYWLVRARELSDQSANNPRFSLLSAVWKRLPTPLSRLLGPVVARYLAW